MAQGAAEHLPDPAALDVGQVGRRQIALHLVDHRHQPLAVGPGPAEQQGQDGGQGQGQEHVHAREAIFAGQVPQRHHQHHGDGANRDGAKLHGPTFGQGQPETVEQVVIAGALFLQAEQVVHLAQRDQAAGAGHEAQYHRFGDVARQVAQLEQGNDDLNGPDHQRQQKNGLEGELVIRAERCRQLARWRWWDR